MRVLVVYGSKLGGTEGIAEVLGEALRDGGVEAVVRPADEVNSVVAFDAVIVGGALYANRWHHSARRIVNRHMKDLRRVPVWLFSSGPLDATADENAIAAVPQVAVLMQRVGARGHRTFGGRLSPDAKGFVAHEMAKTKSGDWRNPERIRAWAAEILIELPTARPGEAIDPPARSVPRLLGHGAMIAGVAAAALLAFFAITGGVAGWLLHAIVTVAAFALVARHYFLAPGAREPLVATVVFASMFAIAELSVAGVVRGEFAASIRWFWMPLVLGAAASALAGVVSSMVPSPRRSEVSLREPLHHA